MAAYPDRRMFDVLLLGAGFSKALSESMPITDELGRLVLDAVNSRAPEANLVGSFDGGSFESWLSRIAEEQPDLTDSENRRNNWLFSLCSIQLARVLEERTNIASASVHTFPWLKDLIHALHSRRATVCTFNQDVLFEHAIKAARVSVGETFLSPAGPEYVCWPDTLRGLPALPTEFRRPSAVATLRLIKLHGSINWYWQPMDASGSTIHAWHIGDDSPSAFTDEDREQERDRALPGLVPMIVPPSAAKSGFYRTPFLSKLWQDARAALIEAQNLYIVGYSAPQTDLVTVGMLRETVGDQGFAASVPISIVNPQAEAVCRSLTAAGISRHRLSHVDDVESFARAYVRDAAGQLIDHLRQDASSNGRALLIGSDYANWQKVVSMTVSPDGSRLLIEPATEPPYQGTTRSAHGSRPLVSAEELRLLLEQHSSVRVLVRSDAQGEAVVLSVREHDTDVGAGDGRWQVLNCTP